MKILYCAYRDWATKIFHFLQPLTQHKIVWAPSQETLEILANSVDHQWDVIVLVGWSWKVPENIVNNNLVIGMHPSDLPDYAGGSPIQNQILDGVEQTNATLFKLNERFDEGEIIDKEPIDLRGHLNDVFESISRATLKLLIRFIENYPSNKYEPQNKKGKSVKRLKPKDSCLPLPTNIEDVYLENEYFPTPIVKKQFSCKELWDHIRCHEDPYPNAYFEDETGKLIIKLVEFEPKK